MKDGAKISGVLCPDGIPSIVTIAAKDPSSKRISLDEVIEKTDKKLNTYAYICFGLEKRPVIGPASRYRGRTTALLSTGPGSGAGQRGRARTTLRIAKLD
jgi:hypothetical protein